MEKRLLDPNYCFRPPKPSRFWEWALTPVRRRVYRDMYGVRDLELQGEAHVQAALDAGDGVSSSSMNVAKQRFSDDAD